MRLGQAHRAGPFAADHLGQVGGLQRVGGIGLDRGGRALGQAGVEAERHVGRAEHLLDHLADRVGQALAAPLRIGVEPGPAALGKGLVGLGKALGGADDAVLIVAAFLVAAGVQGRDDVARHLRRFLQHRRGQVGGEFLERGQVAIAIVGMQLVEHEAHVAQGRVVDLHRSCPSPGPTRAGPALSIQLRAQFLRGLPVVSMCSTRATVRSSRSSAMNAWRSSASMSLSARVSTRSASPPLSTVASWPATTSS